MIKINIICVGKLKEKYLRLGVDEYIKRLTPFARISIIELSEYKLPNNPSNTQIASGLKEEAKGILSHFGKSFVISLCVEGKKYSSEELARTIENTMLCGNSEISFVIGSSYGLDESIKRKSNIRLSVSDMTFPHQLMRLILCEQIYRSFQILSNTKYHK